MKPVFQTKFALGKGDCLNAAIASVLERPLDDIPYLAGAEDGRWFERLYAWCKAEQIGLMCLQPGDTTAFIMANFYCVLIHEVIGVPEENHAVVGYVQRGPSPDGQFEWTCQEVHDPNRGRHKLGELVHIIVLIPAPAAQPQERAMAG